MSIANVVPELTLGALAGSGVAELPEYAAIMTAAYAAAPPPYGARWYGDLYRRCAAQPGWLESSLVANADKEATGSRGLWRLSAACDDAEIAKRVKNHAIDESRHALYYIAMLKSAFPDSVTDDEYRELQSISPGYTIQMNPELVTPRSSDRVTDELIQMNIGEIRTRLHQLLLRPVISALAADSNSQRIALLLDQLLADETRHIAYTARLIEAACGDPRRRRFVEEMFRHRVAEFNQITLEEVGVADEAEFE